MKNRYVIIMAGGIGSRFWPLSRTDRPKQFLDILGTGETLLQQTFGRFKSVCPAENILVVTSDEHRNLVQEQLAISNRRILSEPFRRNTAPCIAYGTYTIFKENSDAVIAVTPADHLVSDKAAFTASMKAGFDFAEKNDVLLTLGVTPDKPETGYGYIRADMDPAHGKNIFRVKSFTEKPDAELAAKFIQSGDYFWNSGIFIWSAETIKKAFDDFLPEIGSAFRNEMEILGTPDEAAAIKRIYKSVRNISIDYGILEKAPYVYVLTADIGWSDLGTWSSLSEHSYKDVNGNSVIRGNSCIFESTGNIISTVPGKKIIMQGLNDFIVVDTGDALLVIRKSDEQKIKNYLEILNQ